MERLSGNFLLLSVFVDISLDNICTFNHAGILVKKVDSASKSQETYVSVIVRQLYSSSLCKFKFLFPS